MPSFAFGSHPYSVEISADGDSDLDSLSEVDLESGGGGGGLPVKKLHSNGDKRRRRRRKKKRKRRKKKKEGKDCRICHLPLESSIKEEDEDGDGDDDDENDSGGDEEDEDDEEEYYGLPLQLGCNCKGDLGVAHSKCAETWFKIKGNMTCEICGAMALNVAGEQSNADSTASTHSQAATGQPQIPMEPRGMWHGRRVMNFLLAAMVFAFIVSWLFHFKVLK